MSPPSLAPACPTYLGNFYDAWRLVVPSKFPNCLLHFPHKTHLYQAPMYYRNANCAVVVYDITQSASLEKARSWIRELQRQADPSIVIALCGNKSDLAARRQVTEEEAKKYADEEGLMWAETSAKSGEGVNEIFTAIGEYSLPLSRALPLSTPLI